MAGFAQALRSYRLGSLTQEELLSEVYRQLTVEKTSPSALLDILKFQQIAEPLPAATHDSLLARLSNWPQDPTVSTADADDPAARPAPVVVGDVIQGRFSVVALIGSGGMSYVYKAVDLRKVETGAQNPFVAVKVLTAPLSDYYGSLTALQREAHKLQSLSHPNIVRVIDCDRDGPIVFMTMEYLEGESLQTKLRNQKTGIDGGEDFILKIAEALRYAHANHILHGDLKPGNVIITDAGEVKVIDFGMARFMAQAGNAPEAEAGHAVDVPGAVTPRYASPDVLSGHKPEPSDDIFALGCLAYEILTGQHPFGRNVDPKQRDTSIVPARPAGMAYGAGAARYVAIVHALRSDRSQRTQTVQRFIDEFSGAVLRRSRLQWLAAGTVVFAVLALAWIWRGTRGSSMPPAVTSSRAPAVAFAAPAAGSVIRDCPTCPVMTVVPAGEFTQGALGLVTAHVGASAGANAGDSYAKPAHMVHISGPFALSTNEVTVGEFREFIDATRREMSTCNVYDGQWQINDGASWLEPGFAQTATHPAVCISWSDATAYAAWLAARTGHRYRLPSASEWEYAARAGGDASAPWGDAQNQACTAANVADQSAAQRYPGWDAFACNDGFIGTAPVGSFKANAFGLNDLLGNAFEWVQDCWHADYRGAPADGSARLDGDCREHELRGGSWFSAPQFVSTWYRNRFPSDYRSSSVGFRVARTIE